MDPGMDPGMAVSAPGSRDWSKLWLWLPGSKNRPGSEGTGGMLGDMATGRVRGVPKLQSPMAAAKSASSSSCNLVFAVEGRVSMLECRKLANDGECNGALSLNELDGMDW